MKKFIKILVPILLTVIVLTSIGWYLFKYDRGFTQDFLLQRARVSDERGNHRISTFYYNLAYRLSGEDESVAIELANQFKSAKNYTKAEYTLSNAIADGGSAELYIALCKTYVEQDKLLDAVNMLDNITDPSIKSKLEAMRPRAPEATPGDGYYNEYIDVTLSSDATIYWSIAPQYPSIHDEPYHTPISIAGGETTIYALAINDIGLVSSVRTLGYTVAGVIEEVTISDPGLNTLVREQLNVSEEYVLFSNQLWNVTDLTITEDVADLSDLTLLPFLETLTIEQGSYKNMTVISSLSNLHTLNVDGVTLSSDDLVAIASLPELTSLSVTRCNLSTVQDLSGAVSLKHLDLSNNTIRDLEPLSSMSELSYLNISHNAVTQLSTLTGAANLTELDLSYNSVFSTAALSGCKKLEVLNLDYNSLTALEEIEQLTALRSLSASHNQITSIPDFSALTALTDLNVSYNTITDITLLASVNSLQNLNFSHNQVSVLPTFTAESKLTSIDGSGNLLTSLDPLVVLTQINYVLMDDNKGITTIASLGACYSLVEVRVLGTAVTDPEPLKSMNVLVHYTPIPVAPVAPVAPTAPTEPAP